MKDLLKFIVVVTILMMAGMLVRAIGLPANIALDVGVVLGVVIYLSILAKDKTDE